MTKTLTRVPQNYPTASQIGVMILISWVSKTYEEGVSKLRICHSSEMAKNDIPATTDTILPDLCNAGRKSGDVSMGPQERPFRSLFNLNNQSGET